MRAFICQKLYVKNTKMITYLSLSVLGVGSVLFEYLYSHCLVGVQVSTLGYFSKVALPDEALDEVPSQWSGRRPRVPQSTPVMVGRRWLLREKHRKLQHSVLEAHSVSISHTNIHCSSSWSSPSISRFACHSHAVKKRNSSKTFESWIEHGKQKCNTL